MSRALVVAAGGAGGDLRPLVAAALAVQWRGHDLVLAGDASVRQTVDPIRLEVVVFPPQLSLGPRLIGAIREAMASSGGDLAAAVPLVRARLTE